MEAPAPPRLGDMRPILCALVGALVVAAAATAGAQRPLDVKVDHVRAYLDVAGRGKGELLIRVFSRYGRRGVKGKWWGVTEASVRGPGGVVNVADIRRLHHPERGEHVDHRLLIRPEAARRLLGKAGARAHLEVTAAAYLIPIRAPGSAKRLSCCTYGAKIHTVSSFPGEERTFGGAVSVDWTEDPPYHAYVSEFVGPNGYAFYDLYALIGSNNAFSTYGDNACADNGSFAGTVTPGPNSDGTFADDTVMQVSWDAPVPLDPDGCPTGTGQARYAIDPLSG